jgi:hypothetical protein
MDSPRPLCETVPRAPSAKRQLLAEMMEGLQTNQAVLKGMLNWYGVFAFTGGAVPSGQCEVVAINSYLKSPFATAYISTEEIERYRYLIESMMMPTVGVPARPRTLRCRKQIADAFSQRSSEIHTLGNRLESALTMRDQLVPAQAKV